MEDRKADAVAHLALARSQNVETGTLGITKDKRQLLEMVTALTFCVDNDYIRLA